MEWKRTSSLKIRRNHHIHVLWTWEPGSCTHSRSCPYVVTRSNKSDDSMGTSDAKTHVSQVQLKEKEDHNYSVLCPIKCSRGAGERRILRCITVNDTPSTSQRHKSCDGRSQCQGWRGQHEQITHHVKARHWLC